MAAVLREFGPHRNRFPSTLLSLDWGTSILLCVHETWLHMYPSVNHFKCDLSCFFSSLLLILLYIPVGPTHIQTRPKPGLNKPSRWAASGLTGNRQAMLSDHIPFEGDKSEHTLSEAHWEVQRQNTAETMSTCPSGPCSSSCLHLQAFQVTDTSCPMISCYPPRLPRTVCTTHVLAAATQAGLANQLCSRCYVNQLNKKFVQLNTWTTLSSCPFSWQGHYPNQFLIIHQSMMRRIKQASRLKDKGPRSPTYTTTIICGAWTTTTNKPCRNPETTERL